MPCRFVGKLSFYPVFCAVCVICLRKNNDSLVFRQLSPGVDRVDLTNNNFYHHHAFIAFNQLILVGKVYSFYAYMLSYTCVS